jgi:hypothetical protein
MHVKPCGEWDLNLRTHEMSPAKSNACSACSYPSIATSIFSIKPFPRIKVLVCQLLRISSFYDGRARKDHHRYPFGSLCLTYNPSPTSRTSRSTIQATMPMLVIPWLAASIIDRGTRAPRESARYFDILEQSNDNLGNSCYR